MKKVYVRLLAVFTIVAMFSWTGFVSAGDTPIEGLFNDLLIQGDTGMATDPTIVRSKFVEVDFNLLGTMDTPADSVKLNLFEGAIFTAVLDRTELNRKGGFNWIGHLEGINYSQVILMLGKNSLTGSVDTTKMKYHVRSAGDNVHAIDEIDQSAFPPEMEPIPVSPLYIFPLEDPIAMGDDTCERIDVLVAYTPEARAADEADGLDILDTIAVAVAETNQSYINSGLTQRINLVHTMETNPGDAVNDFSPDLYALQDLSDGKFDNVDAARDTYYADAVALIIENSGSCGLGFLMQSVDSSFKTWAFSVTHRTCATGYYSFGHELGHNMGARHDWYVDDESGDNPYPYDKAFVNVEDRWRTIMGYNNICGDSPPGTYCTRLQYWSNPDVSHNGDSMGIISSGPTNCIYNSFSPDPSTCAADNRMTLNNTCTTFANFRVCECSESYALVSGQWKQVSLACDVGDQNTVEDVFGDDLDIAKYNDPNGGWLVYERDETTDTYNKLTLDDTLATGVGYWILSRGTNPVIDTEGVCNQQLDVPLVSEATEGRHNLMGHPFAYDVNWSDVLVVDGSSVLTLGEADPVRGSQRACEQTPVHADCVMSRVMRIWNGSAYESYDGITAGSLGVLQSMDGFWVKAFKDGISLRIPATGGVVPAMDPSIQTLGDVLESKAMKTKKNAEWHVRLIVESGNLQDPGNIFGQLSDSKHGPDIHDLKELPPFGDKYLTVVFPHKNWGDYAGDYTTDFHRLSRKTRGKWNFQVRASDPTSEVTLRWVGPESVIKKSVLVDRKTRKRVKPNVDGSYTFKMDGKKRRAFKWIVSPKLKNRN